MLALNARVFRTTRELDDWMEDIVKRTQPKQFWDSVVPKIERPRKVDGAMKPENDPRLYETSCAGKERFPTVGSANGYLEYLRKPRRNAIIRLDGDISTMTAYHCRFSTPDDDHWHVGHL